MMDMFGYGPAVVYVGDDQRLKGWFFDAWQFRPGLEQPYWLVGLDAGLEDGDWVVRRVGDHVPFIVVKDDLYQAEFRPAK